MKNELHLQKDFSVSSTVVRLVFVGGVMLSCMYGLLVVFASAFKILG